MKLYWQHVARLSDDAGWGYAIHVHVLKEYMKSYVVLDEINFTLNISFNDSRGPTMGYMNVVQYFKFSQIWALGSAVEILTFFWVSPQGCVECSGDCPLKAEEGSLAITGAANEAARPREKQLSLLNCILPPVWRFMPHPAWVGPRRHVALPEVMWLMGVVLD